jgi:hypothetical protein
MIAFSSYKPFSKSAAVAQNQRIAKASWEKVFDRIVYLGPPEPALSSPKTEFIPCDDYPIIKTFCQLATRERDWSCIINADIVVSPKLREVAGQLKIAGADTAVSRRWEVDGNGPPQLLDFGLDFFAAVPWVWSHASFKIPSDLLIGHSDWDTWLLGFFQSTTGNRTYDLTDERLIFHPKHGDRDYTFKGFKQVVRIMWPFFKLPDFSKPLTKQPLGRTF